MRKLQAGGDVADCPDAGHRGVESLVHGHKTAIECDAGFFETESLCRRPAADRDEQVVSLVGCAVLKRDRDAVVGL